MTRKLFTWFSYLSILALFLMGAGDLFFFVFGGAGQTLSYQFWILAKQYPVVPWLLGVLNGHLVWQYNPDFISPTKSGTRSQGQ